MVTYAVQSDISELNHHRLKAVGWWAAEAA